jgi:hypothetical protein
VFPIIGGRKVEQLKENIAALDISLTAEQIKRIEEATPFDPGFPHNMIVRVFSVQSVSMTHDCLRGNFVDVFVDQGDGTDQPFLTKSSAHYDRVPVQQAITPTPQN